LKYILEDYSVQCEYDTTQNLLNVTRKKEVEGCRIFTVPVLIVCQCQREKNKAGADHQECRDQSFFPMAQGDD
jgi:hypothetical protein